ncbi:hypothetical protein [Kaistia sp. MMO-174]|uniref:hypothetical protein n=1 Tax=Kaistia sp. MMO-174 TaxID=3081256 RepID=UPI00301B480F
MVATWPLANRKSPDAASYSEAPQSNRITFEPEIGPTIDRRRGTAAGTMLNIQFTGITDDERETFEDWYRSTLYDGVLPFVWVDPIRGTSASFRFTKDTYELRPHPGAEYHDLSFQLYRLP